MNGSGFLIANHVLQNFPGKLLRYHWAMSGLNVGSSDTAKSGCPSMRAILVMPAWVRPKRLTFNLQLDSDPNCPPTHHAHFLLDGPVGDPVEVW